MPQQELKLVLPGLVCRKLIYNCSYPRDQKMDSASHGQNSRQMNLKTNFGYIKINQMLFYIIVS